jgi:hypothetical protein
MGTYQLQLATTALAQQALRATATAAAAAAAATTTAASSLMFHCCFGPKTRGGQFGAPARPLAS